MSAQGWAADSEQKPVAALIPKQREPNGLYLFCTIKKRTEALLLRFV